MCAAALTNPLIRLGKPIQKTAKPEEKSPLFEKRVVQEPSLGTRRFTLLVLPEQDLDSFISFIERAKKSIELTAYKIQVNRLTHPRILEALQKAVQRSVKVHLLVEDRLTQMEVAPKPTGAVNALQALKERGITVHSGSRDKPYNQIHTKFGIIDYKTDTQEAILGTTNFDKDPEAEARPPARDFSLFFFDASIIDELHKSFWSDIKGTPFEVTHPQLLWGPGNQREKMLALIHSAENSIRIYQQDITDTAIIDALLLSIRNNVEVELIMSPRPFGPTKPDNNVSHQKKLKAAGGRVYLTDKLTVHAKVLIIDDRTIYIGSTNFYKPAIDETRNVGLLLQDDAIISQVLAIMAQDKLAARL